MGATVVGAVGTDWMAGGGMDVAVAPVRRGPPHPAASMIATINKTVVMIRRT
jgi:hypothetical protein